MDKNIFILLGYVFGSIPFGLVLCYIFGYGDIRKIGSGNIGATNVLRTGNKILAFFTLALDLGKGALAVLLTVYLTNDISLSAWVGVASVLGHNFPIWLGFKGGKGVSTSIGTLFAINPLVGLFTAITWLISSKLLKISSASALIALLLAPIYAQAIGLETTTLQISILTALGFIRHKDNIKRLLNGTEPKIGKK